MTKLAAETRLTDVQKAALARAGAHLEQMGALLAGAQSIGDLRNMHEYGKRLDFSEIEAIDIGGDDVDDIDRLLDHMSQTTEGRDAALQALADENAVATESHRDEPVHDEFDATGGGLPDVAAALESQRTENDGAGESGGLLNLAEGKPLPPESPDHAPIGG